MKTKTRLFSLFLTMSLLLSASASATDFMSGMKGYSYSQSIFTAGATSDTLYLIKDNKLLAFTSPVAEPMTILDFATSNVGIYPDTTSYSLIASPMDNSFYILDSYGGILYPQFGNPVKLHTEGLGEPLEDYPDCQLVSFRNSFILGETHELFTICDVVLSRDPYDAVRKVIAFDMYTGDYREIHFSIPMDSVDAITDYGAGKFLVSNLSNNSVMVVDSNGVILETLFSTENLPSMSEYSQLFFLTWDYGNKIYFPVGYTIQSFDLTTREIKIVCSSPDDAFNLDSFFLWDNRLALLTTSGLYTYDLDPERAQQEELILYERFSDTW